MTDTTNFRAAARWVPTPFQVRRGQIAARKVFNEPMNLPLRAFARRAGKSPCAVVRDVRRRRLLGLFLGKQGPHIPGWQLEAMPRRLTERILRDARRVDGWTIYLMLSGADEAFGFRAPVDVVTFGSFERVREHILGRLGIHT